MNVQPAQSTIESLAGISQGEDFEIVKVLLNDAIRSDPHQYLRPGRRWRCRYNGSATILLTDTGGATISINHDVARFIQIRRVSLKAGSAA